MFANALKLSQPCFRHARPLMVSLVQTEPIISSIVQGTVVEKFSDVARIIYIISQEISFWQLRHATKCQSGRTERKKDLQNRNQLSTMSTWFCHLKE